jgi:hypothetical protein
MSTREVLQRDDPDLADTIAHILVDVYAETGVDGEYAGFFVDDATPRWPTGCATAGTAATSSTTTRTAQRGLNGDAEEKTASSSWHIDLVRAIRREFAERDMPNRLVIVPNTTWGRKADPSPKDDQYMGLLDGMLNEAWNLYWPGHATATNTATWDMALNWRYQLTHAQTSRRWCMWNARATPARST